MFYISCEYLSIIADRHVYEYDIFILQQDNFVLIDHGVGT